MANEFDKDRNTQQPGQSGQTGNQPGNQQNPGQTGQKNPQDPSKKNPGGNPDEQNNQQDRDQGQRRAS